MSILAPPVPLVVTESKEEEVTDSAVDAQMAPPLEAAEEVAKMDDLTETTGEKMAPPPQGTFAYGRSKRAERGSHGLSSDDTRRSEP